MDIWQQILDFEPFLRTLDIQAEVLEPDEVVLRLPTRQEIANLPPWETKKRARLVRHGEAELPKPRFQRR